MWLRDGVPVLGVEGPRYRLGERNRLEIRGKKEVASNTNGKSECLVS